MSTQQVQHDAFQKELSKDFKDIYVKYREQLVKTKVIHSMPQSSFIVVGSWILLIVERHGQ